MSNEKFFLPEHLTQGYWEGHMPEDLHIRERNTKIVEYAHLEPLKRQNMLAVNMLLDDFLKDEREAIRTVTEYGKTLQIDSLFPNSIIHLTKEVLLSHGPNPYHKGNYYGVIQQIMDDYQRPFSYMHLTERDEENYVLDRRHEVSNLNPIEVGTVKHIKRVSENGEEWILERITEAEILKIGQLKNNNSGKEENIALENKKLHENKSTKSYEGFLQRFKRK